MPKDSDVAGLPLANGFILSEAAMYSFLDQDVFPDIVSFSAAIPVHLRSLFLIPITAEFVVASEAAVRVAFCRTAEGYQPDGQTEESDWFGTKTFVYDDIENTKPSSEPGSIFDVDGADNMTHHQDLPSSQDENWQVPTDTSYMSDVDVTESYIRYPYRTEEAPVRHSCFILDRRVVRRVALQPHELESKVPDPVKDKASSCSVKLVSYDKRGRVFTFNVGCGNGSKTVRASLSDINHVAMDCDCPFWQWNGPAFHAKTNSYALGPQRGTASPPDQRDPDRKFFLCKHAYAVLARMDEFVQDIVDDSWELSDEDVMDKVDSEWDKMEETAEIPLEEAEADQVDVDWEEPESEEPESESEESVEAPPDEEEEDGDGESEPTEEDAYPDLPSDEDADLSNDEPEEESDLEEESETEDEDEDEDLGKRQPW